MATQCMNPEPHDPHPWAIEPNPGEDGPDWFHCDGRTTRFVAYQPPPVQIRLGRVDTSDWPVQR